MVDKNYSLLKDELYKNKRIEKIGLTSNPFGGITAETHIKGQKKMKIWLLTIMLLIIIILKI